MVSGLRNVRLSTVIIVAAAAVITLLFLPLTVSTNDNNNNTLIQSKSAFAQVQEEDASGTTNATTMTNETTTTTEPIDFLSYNNPAHGIFIQYPSDWTASTSGLEDYTDLIAFYSPLQNTSDPFPARLAISVITYSQNISLPEYTDFLLTPLNQSEQIDVTSSSEVTVAGYPGHRVVVVNSQPFQNSTLIFNRMITWTTIGNKVYLLSYEGEESAFNRHLPEVNQILESLSIQQVM
jgi:hypothetical protein